MNTPLKCVPLGACGGVLHSARYPRKPRGGPPELRQTDNSRLSFCCAQCRRRHTPRSVRYLGRRVYLATVVVFASRNAHGHHGSAGTSWVRR